MGNDPRISIDHRRLGDLCRRWRITELALFGSVMRDDFRPESDVDVLLTFAPDAGWSLFEIVELQRLLEELFGRRVDVVEQNAIRNPYRREAIMATRQVIYEAA